MIKKAVVKTTITFILLCQLLVQVGFTTNQESARKELESLGIPITDEAFVESVRKGNTDIVKLFLASGISPNAKDKYGEPALIYAVFENYIDIVKYLLEAGANPNTKDNTDQTALMYALLKGNALMVETLLDAGADVNYESRDGSSPWLQAVGLGQIEIMEAMLEHGLDINSRLTTYRHTPLILVARDGYTSIVRALLDKDADPNAQGDFGMTALMFAAANGHTDIVRALLNKGANVNAKNNSGWTALKFAKDYVKRGGSSDIVFLLRDAGGIE